MKIYGLGFKAGNAPSISGLFWELRVVTSKANSSKEGNVTVNMKHEI